jgi:hypothetical protein
MHAHSMSSPWTEPNSARILPGTPQIASAHDIRTLCQERGWTRSRLINELRHLAELRSSRLPSDESMKRTIAKWVNGHHSPPASMQNCSPKSSECGSRPQYLTPVRLRLTPKSHTSTSP